MFFINIINGGANKKNVQSLEDYFRNEVYKFCSDEEIKLVLPLMRKRIKWAENHPGQADPYEALGSVYQDNYAIIQQLADMRGIVVDDLPDE